MSLDIQSVVQRALFSTPLCLIFSISTSGIFREGKSSRSEKRGHVYDASISNVTTDRGLTSVMFFQADSLGEYGAVNRSRESKDERGNGECIAFRDRFSRKAHSRGLF